VLQKSSKTIRQNLISRFEPNNSHEFDVGSNQINGDDVIDSILSGNNSDYGKLSKMASDCCARSIAEYLHYNHVLQAMLFIEQLFCDG
jgi:hypothetical protein